MTYRLGVLSGDGIGPEIVEATVRVLEAAQQRDSRLRFEWVRLPMGWEAIRATGSALPETAIEALKKCDAWILGPHDSVSYPPALREKLNPSGELRIRFDLYANIRPARAYPGLRAVCPKMDLVIARENTEGFYADRNMAWGIGEFMPTPDVALAVGKITRQATERIARTAFALARQRRRKVAIVHKANVLRKTSGLFLEVCRTVGKDYPEVAIEDYHIDAMTALLVRRGADFDVIFDHHNAGLRDFDSAAAFAGIPETVTANHNTGVQNHAIAQAATFPHHHIRVQYALRADDRIFTDEYPRKNDGALTELRTCADPGVGKNRHALIHCCTLVDVRTGTDLSVESRRRTKQL